MKCERPNNPYGLLDEMIERYRKSLSRDHTPLALDLSEELEVVKEILYGAAIKAGKTMMSSREVPFMSSYPFGKQRQFTMNYRDGVEIVEDIVVDDEAILEEDT